MKFKITIIAILVATIVVVTTIIVSNGMINPIENIVIYNDCGIDIRVETITKASYDTIIKNGETGKISKPNEFRHDGFSVFINAGNERVRFDAKRNMAVKNSVFIKFNKDHSITINENLTSR